MARNGDDSVTLEMTWVAVQAAAKKHNCTIQQITNEQVKEQMPRGSQGCITAYTRQIKLQELAAQTYDLNVFSPGFKSAVVFEIRRFVANAVEVARQEARVTEEMFDQACKDLDAAQETISSLRTELATNAARASEEIRHLELELAGARVRLASLEEVKLTLTASRDEMARAHEGARNEVMGLKVGLAEAAHKYEAERATVSALQQRLADTERDREVAAQKAALAEQRAAHAESVAAEGKDRIKELRDELTEAKADRRNLETRLATLHEQASQAKARLDKNDKAKSATAGTGGGKSGKAAGQTGNGASLA